MTMRKAHIRILSYNIHKGFSPGGINFVLGHIKNAIQSVQADLVFLQEVLGHHEGSRQNIKGWPTNSQFEYLADNLWPHVSYGQNAAYTDGHHGNAILSKHPFSSGENIDISTTRYAKRGLLHGIIKLPGKHCSMHAICLHLDLLKSGRKIQSRLIANRILRHVPSEDPLIIAGDFNDWRGHAGEHLETVLGVKEALQEHTGYPARTFPAQLPVLRLDRIYYRGLELIKAKRLTEKPWNRLSDHLALYAEFRLL